VLNYFLPPSGAERRKARSKRGEGGRKGKDPRERGRKGDLARPGHACLLPLLHQTAVAAVAVGAAAAVAAAGGVKERKEQQGCPPSHWGVDQEFLVG